MSCLHEPEPVIDGDGRGAGISGWPQHGALQNLREDMSCLHEPEPVIDGDGRGAGISGWPQRGALQNLREDMSCLHEPEPVIDGDGSKVVIRLDSAWTQRSSGSNRLAVTVTVSVVAGGRSEGCDQVENAVQCNACLISSVRLYQRAISPLHRKYMQYLRYQQLAISSADLVARFEADLRSSLMPHEIFVCIITITMSMRV